MKSTVLALFAAMLAVNASVAVAGGLDRERVHEDSFGNLVIHSPAGYKRILVGAGGSAVPAAHGGPRVAYHAGERLRLTPARDCRFGAVLLHGRSYMYGLPEGVVPTPADELCR